MLRVITVEVIEATECPLDSLRELLVDDLLALLLHDPLRIVLTSLRVDTRAEANDGLLSRMTHIDADQHGARVKLLRELKVEQVTAQLGVDLTQDVRSNGEVKAAREVLVADALRDHLVLVSHSLDLLVEAFLRQHHNDNGWSLLSLDEFIQLMIKRNSVINATKLDPRGILNCDAKLN